MASLIRPHTLTAALRRSAVSRPHQRLLPSIPSRLASSGYGDGEGNPVGENPQKQGANPSANKEHPGPPPPKAGEGSGSSPTKGTSEGHTKADQSSSGQKRQFSTMRTLFAEKKPKSTEGLSPKILDESPPADEEAPEEVKKHNENFDKRADRAHEATGNSHGDKEKVDPKFWSEDKGNEQKKD